MLFLSIEYIVFFPVVFLFYWVFCKRNKDLQNGLIVIASLIFYGWWEWRFVSLLLLVAFSTFITGWWMQKEGLNKKRKWILIGTIVFNLGILFVFKYYNFFVQFLVDAFSVFGKELTISGLKIILPVGISFYTFTALSYSIDVYQRKVPATRDLLAYLAYVMFFPSILSGPINRAQKQLPQYFCARKFDYVSIVNGCKLMLLGGNEIVSCRSSWCVRG